MQGLNGLYEISEKNYAQRYVRKIARGYVESYEKSYANSD